MPRYEVPNLPQQAAAVPLYYFATPEKNAKLLEYKKLLIAKYGDVETWFILRDAMRAAGAFEKSGRSRASDLLAYIELNYNHVVKALSRDEIRAVLAQHGLAPQG